MSIFTWSGYRFAQVRAVRAAILIACAGAACDQDSPGARRAPDGAGDETTLVHVRRLTVEENRQVLNVRPTVRADPRGGFLVADGGESQIRRYSGEGALLWFAGRLGAGPGEFRNVVAVARLGSGNIVAADRDGRLTFFDADGRQVIHTVETRLSHLLELEVVNDSTLLLSGVGEGGMSGPRLHLWSVARDRFESSFFAPFARQRNRAAAISAGYVTAALRGDTVAASFATSDTIYLMTLDGRDIGVVPLKSRHFRPTPPEGPRQRMTDPLQVARWMSKFDMVSDVQWRPDGGLSIAYQSIDPDRAMERHWHLLVQDREGRQRLEYRDIPPVLGADPGNSILFLVAPGAEVPNRWLLARLP